ncbi:MAG: ATP-binding cassette domain-containing protein [Pseudorhodobacter sp.]|nr:ATP-binding cassette domain-containing protein [Pseudorhodobacter sp.]
MNTGLQLLDLTVTLATKTIASVNAHIAPGEVLTIMGPSGSGKSTLLAALTGTLDPAFRLSGRIVLNGCDITTLPPQQRRIGLLFQDDLLFPHLTVAGNLAFALPSAITPMTARHSQIAAALADMGLSGFGPRNPATLSGGQRARVALARCLLSNPQALALDEPFSRLDTNLRAQTRDLVFRHAIARNLPVILVTHDPEDAKAAGGPIIPPHP